MPNDHLFLFAKLRTADRISWKFGYSAGLPAKCVSFTRVTFRTSGLIKVFSGVTVYF